MPVDTATYQSFGGTIIITKTLLAASANNICLSQTPTANTPLLLNGTTAGVLDTQRRILFTTGSEAAQRTLLLTGLNSQGTVINETITIPASTSGTVASQRDYLVVTSILPSASFTAAITVGTNTTGSTTPVIPSHYTAAFDFACQVNVTGTATAQIEFTRDIPYALPQPYVNGYSFMPPNCLWDIWPTLGNITVDSVSDIDSPVMGVRLTVISGTGLVTARMTPLGLRT